MIRKEALIIAIGRVIQGTNVNLRPVEESDAQFILMLRSDPLLCAYINPISKNTDDQVRWINAQRTRENDYYFVIEYLDGVKVGLISLYNCTDTDAEFGRWVCPNARIAARESIVLMHQYAFESTNREKAYLRVDIRNTKAIAIYQKIGYKETSESLEITDLFRLKKMILHKNTFYKNAKNFLMTSAMQNTPRHSEEI